MTYSALAQRCEGRLFSRGGHLCLVVGVDLETGFASVSARTEHGPQVTQMPLTEVVECLASVPQLKLDGLSNERSHARVVSKDEGWYFVTREGEKGPYRTEKQAQRRLTKYILLAQEEGRTDRPEPVEAIA
ncbi:MAG: DUF6316 family protein [Pseudomonadota bacterium]